jgi:membrane protein required for colicin V production
MAVIDISIEIGLLLFGVLGFRDGFFKKLFGFFGIWGGLILAIKYMNPLSEILSQWLDLSTEMGVVTSFFLIFLFSVLVVNIIYRWFGSSASDTMNMKNRIAGCVLGFGQGVITASLVLIMLSIFDMPSQEDRQTSLLYGKIVGVAPIVFDYSTRWMPTSTAFFDVVKTRIETFRAPR